MFDARHGKELADKVYERILVKEDVSLWYSYYNTDECWARAASDITDIMHGDDLTDLMAWVISKQDFYNTPWNDGFVYLFGSLLADRYESENFGEE